jgi:hypothetical protein
MKLKYESFFHGKRVFDNADEIINYIKRLELQLNIGVSLLTRKQYSKFDQLKRGCNMSLEWTCKKIMEKIRKKRQRVVDKNSKLRHKRENEEHKKREKEWDSVTNG